MTADPRSNSADSDETDERSAGGASAADTQAAMWLARQRDALDATERARFHAWLAEDEIHRNAYAQMSAAADRVRRLPDDALAGLRARLRRDTARAASAARPGPPGPTAKAGRGWFGHVGSWGQGLSAAVAVLALVVGGWVGWDHWQRQPTFVQAYETQRGQQSTVTLPDGSSLQLDTATRVEVSLYRQRREARLLEGQAMFSVASVAGTAGVSGGAHGVPFTVQAGSLRVAVVGTVFAVRHTAAGLEPGGVSVSVQEGHVRVSPRNESGAPGAGMVGAPVDLTAGQRVAADATGRLGDVTRAPPDTAARWREGRLSFENTPLAEALAEFERYGPTGLKVSDPKVAALRIGGSFDVRRMDRFAAALPQMLPVRLVRQGGHTEIVGTR